MIASCFFLLTAFLGYMSFSSLSLKVVLEAMLPIHHPNVELMAKFGAQFGGANTTLIMVENTEGTIYNEKFMTAYKRVADEIYFHPSVQRHLVQALTLRKTKAIVGSAGRIDINAIAWPDLPRSPTDWANFEAAVKAQYRGLLVSDDERAGMIIADFKDDTDYAALVNFVEALGQKEAGNGIKLHMVGRPVLLGTIDNDLGATILLIGISLIFSGIILYLYFRSWVGVLIPMLTAAIGTLWGTGVMALVGFNLDPLLIILPVFVFAIVLSHCVQFMSRVFERLNPGVSMREAVEGGLAQVFVPSLTAIVAAAGGFFVLVMIGVPSLQALGVICGAWLLAIAPALVFTASLLCLMPRPKRFRARTSWVEGVWRLAKFDRYPRVIVGITVLCLAGGIYGSQFVVIGDAVGSPILWPDARYNQDNGLINERFSAVGTDILLVYIDGPEDTMNQPEVYRAAENLSRYIWENEPKARHAQSLVPVVEVVNQVLYEGDPSYAVIPQTTDEVAFNVYLFSSKGEPGDFKAYTNEKWEIGNIAIPLDDKTGQTVKSVTTLARKFIADMAPLPSGATLRVAGGQVGIAEAINSEIEDTKDAVLVAIVVLIMLSVFLAFRSIWVTGVLTFALLTSTFLTDSFMYLMGIGLNINTLPLAALGVGLAADYGIYILHRVRESLVEGHSYEVAVDHALKTSGNAVMITAITMIAPVMPWAFFSALRFQAEMGVLHAVVLFFNMLGALIFVPCMVLLFKPKSLVIRRQVVEPEEPVQLMRRAAE
ncbi:efflux RND transporter permease subunit [Oleomonas cavernae]|uniref:efflux RND transporter permease subunit n=1 Tax=Oleomonas cavernae TaxID=2320859 RepID=UPI001313E3C5|nr:efflux RND transporter permease subunit [Oleomonas cavernae]